MVILQGVITGDLQVNDTDMHRPFRALYCDKESALIIEKLQEHSNKLPSPTRDDIIIRQNLFGLKLLQMLSNKMLLLTSLMVLKTTW